MYPFKRGKNFYRLSQPFCDIITVSKYNIHRSANIFFMVFDKLKSGRKNNAKENQQHSLQWDT